MKTMSIKITAINDRNFKVKGKLVYKDMNDNWVAKFLNQDEAKIANEHIALINRQFSTEKVTHIFFENNGQNFLQWQLKDGVVVKSLPVDTDEWNGFQVDNDDIRVGCFLPVTDNKGDVVKIMHRIEKVHFEE